MARQESAGVIINRTAVEVGLDSVTDPFSTQDKGFSLLVGLLNVAGNELMQLRDWSELTKELTLSVPSALTNNRYALPTDYDRMVDQAAWDLTNDIPLVGPVSTQGWAYLNGRDLASNTIYVHWRINDSTIDFYPNPCPTADISFRYIDRNWAEQSDGTPVDQCTVFNDKVLLDSLLMQKFLKVKYLSAKNLPSQDAKVEFENILQNRYGNDKGATVLNAGRGMSGFHYLDAWNNIGDTNYGV